MKKENTRNRRDEKRFQRKRADKRRRVWLEKQAFRKDKPRKENPGNDGNSFTQLDHAPDTAQLAAWLPPLLEFLKVPKGSILRFISDRSNQYTAEHRVGLESHIDRIDERLEDEGDFKELKSKLRGQEPDKLIDEGVVQGYHKVGMAASSVLLVSSFGATVVVTGMQVQGHSANGSWAYGISVGLIAGFGSSLLKWAIKYPLKDYKTCVEMALVPMAFGFFGLFVYQLTDLFFYMERMVEATQAVPDFSSYLTEEDLAPTSKEAPSSMVSLKWFYIGVLGTEMFSSYAFLSFIETCSLPQFKPIVRSLIAQRENLKAPRRRNREMIRKSRGQAAWLRYLREMSHAPGKALKALFSQLSK